jgi:hypothetical protein
MWSGLFRFKVRQYVGLYLKFNTKFKQNTLSYSVKFVSLPAHCTFRPRYCLKVCVKLPQMNFF